MAMDYDIIIVGSGPAGTSTALHLSKLAPELARRTLILERQRHPRPKLCGGGIPPDGEYILKRLGLDLAQLSHVPVHEAYFNFMGRGGFCLKRQPVSFRVVQRHEFDAWLFDAACAHGVTAHQETRVLNVRPSGDAMEVLTDKGSYRTRVVLGADGAKSIVRKAVDSNPDSSFSRLLEFFVPQSPEGTRPADQDRAFFDFSVIDQDVQGYTWSFPMQKNGGPTRNLGIYDARVHSRSPYGRLKSTMRQKLGEDGVNIDDYQIHGQPIRWFDPEGPLSAPGVLLVGDAAGADPTFGEGISFALGYGELAAQEVKDAFAQGDFSFTNYRNRILNHPMGRCLKRRIRMARFLYGMRNRHAQRFLWWRLGPLMRWYLETFLVDWAK